MAALVKNVEMFTPCFSSFRLLTRLPTPSTCCIAQQGTRGFHSSDVLNGGRPKSFWRTKRQPANTRLNHELPNKIKERKAFGGHKKLKALRINQGLFTLKSCSVELEAPIVNVVHSYANIGHADKNVIVKGSIVQVDVNPFKTWYENHQHDDLEKINKDKLDSFQVNDDTTKLLDGNVLYAKVVTRPGQVGMCNGHILEGQELEMIQSTFNLSATSS